MNSVMTVMLAAALAQSGGEWGSRFEGLDAVASQLDSEIVQNRYQKIAVLPKFDDEREATDKQLIGPLLGAHSTFLAENLRIALDERSAGRFQVLGDGKPILALAGLDWKDLGQPDRLREAGERAGIDALVIGTLYDYRRSEGEADGRSPHIGVSCLLVDLATGQEVAATDAKVRMSIADAALAGESFELRRWRGSELKNVGLHRAGTTEWAEPTDFNSNGKYDDICRSRKHPLDHPLCPFEVTVLVDGEERQPLYLEHKAFVALDASETFAIRVKNGSSRNVYVALFVDGVNVLGKNVEHPSNCRYWYFKQETNGLYRGWYTRQDSSYVEEAFKIGLLDDSVAAKAGSLGKVGQITAVFYTVGTPEQQPTHRQEWVPSSPSHRTPSVPHRRLVSGNTPNLLNRLKAAVWPLWPARPSSST